MKENKINFVIVYEFYLVINLGFCVVINITLEIGVNLIIRVILVK